MRRCLAQLIGTVLVVAACGSDASSTSDATGGGVAAPELGEDGSPVSVPEPPTGGSAIRLPDGEVGSALADPRDPSFPAPLVDLDDLMSGGPPPDGIAPVDEPVYAPIAEIGFLRPQEAVAVVEHGGEAKAYPLEILVWHEIVNTEIGGTPVAVTYCPLCNSAATFRRDVAGGRTIDFGTSGQLYNSSLVMYDRQTQSLWTHFDGRAVVGALTGARLSAVPTSLTSWEQFQAAYPDGSVLTRDTGHRRQYGMSPYAVVGVDDPERRPPMFRGDVDDVLARQARVVALQGDEAVAVVHETLAERGVIELTFDGRDVVALYEAGTASALSNTDVAYGRDVGSTGVFVPEIDGRRLSLDRGPDGGFVDDTGTTWDVFGRAVAGPLEGSRLEPVEHLDTFWFAIASFRPETRLVGLPDA